MDAKTLKEKCIRYRAERKISQKALAEICGVHWLTIMHVENEKPIRPTTEVRILAVIEEQ